MTPFRRYQYLRLTFGMVHAGYDYSRRVTDVFDDIVNSPRVVEDIIVFYKTFADHLEFAHHLFQRENEHSVAQRHHWNLVRETLVQSKKLY